MDPAADPSAVTDPASGAEDDRVDLDAFLSVLERDQLERLVVRMIVKDDENFADLERAVRQLSEDSILEAVESAQIAREEGGLDAALSIFAPFVDKAAGYAKLGLVQQALTVLVNITHPIIAAFLEEDIADEGTDDRAIMDAFMRRLESAWQAAVSKFTPAPSASAAPAATADAASAAAAAGAIAGAGAKADVFMGALVTPPETLDGIFAMLAEWRTELTPRLGPLFSDPLRVLKKAMIKAQKTEAAAAAAAADAAPAAAAPAGESEGKAKGKKGKSSAPAGVDVPSSKRARA